jgi:hypothetical protein
MFKKGDKVRLNDYSASIDPSGIEHGQVLTVVQTDLRVVNLAEVGFSGSIEKRTCDLLLKDSTDHYIYTLSKYCSYAKTRVEIEGKFWYREDADVIEQYLHEFSCAGSRVEVGNFNYLVLPEHKNFLIRYLNGEIFTLDHWPLAINGRRFIVPSLNYKDVRRELENCKGCCGNIPIAFDDLQVKVCSHLADDLIKRYK